MWWKSFRIFISVFTFNLVKELLLRQNYKIQLFATYKKNQSYNKEHVKNEGRKTLVNSKEKQYKVAMEE